MPRAFFVGGNACGNTVPEHFATVPHLGGYSDLLSRHISVPELFMLYFLKRHCIPPLPMLVLEILLTKSKLICDGMQAYTVSTEQKGKHYFIMMTNQIWGIAALARVALREGSPQQRLQRHPSF